MAILNEALAKYMESLAAQAASGDDYDEAGEDLYTGWLSPEGDWYECYSDNGDGASGNGLHEPLARELCDQEGYEYADLGMGHAQLVLMERGWIRVDVCGLDGPSKPTAKQVEQLIEWLDPYYGEAYVGKAEIAAYLEETGNAQTEGRVTP